MWKLLLQRQCVGNCQFITFRSIFLPKATLYIFGNLRVFGNFLDMSTIFFFLLLFFLITIYRSEQNDVIKPFFLDIYSSGQDTMLAFCTLTNTLESYRSEKKLSWQPLCLFFISKHDFRFLVCKICNFGKFHFF